MTLLDKVTSRLARVVPVKPLSSRITDPVVSITFDDFPRSAWQMAGRILDRHQMHATYYVTGSRCATTVDGVDFYTRQDLREVHDAGHEVGAHTYEHFRVSKTDAETLRTDDVRNRDFIREVIPDFAPGTFAFPYGDLSLTTKILFAQRYGCCRGTAEGVNRGVLDLGQLKVVSLESYRWRPQHLREQLRSSAESGTWTIFMTHDVSENPSPWGTTTAVFEATISAVKASGLKVATVSSALGLACYG